MLNRAAGGFVFFALFLSVVQAQSPLTCVTTSGNPALRAEGISEPVGDIFLNCSGGTPGTAVTLNMTIFLNVAITNRISASNATDVSLTIDSGAGPVRAVVPGVLQSSAAVSFNGITFTIPPAGVVNFHISNLRGNISQLGVGLQRPAQATLSFTGAPILANTNPIGVGIATSGLLATLASTGIRCTGSPLPSTTPYTFRSLYEGGTRFVSTRVTEGFPGAFLPKTPASDTGIRIIATYSGFPPGSQVFVPAVVAGSDTLIPTAAGDLGGTPATGLYAPGGGGSLLLSIVNGTDGNGAGGTVAYTPSPGSGQIILNDVTQLNLVNGRGIAVYEVVDANPNQIETAQFPAFLGLPPVAVNAPAPIAAEQVSFAPISTVFQATTSDPIPRFVQVTPPSDCPELADCNANYFPSLSVFAAQPLQFTAPAGAFQLTKTVEVNNKGGGVLSWSASFAYFSGGNWLSVTPGAGVNGGTILVTVYPSNIGPGVYTATLIIDAGPQAGSQSLPITFNVLALPPPAPNPPPTPTPPAPAPAPPAPTPPAPSVTLQGIASAADPTVTAVSPGALAVLTGTNLQGKVVSVTFDGVAAAMISDGATSIEIQVPPALSAGITSQIQVTVDGNQSAPLAAPISEVAPVIFPGGLVNQDGSINSVSNAADVGSELQIFATGLMGVNPAPVLVKLHDRQPMPLYAGPAPGLIGVSQVNVIIPSDLPAMTTEVEVCGYGASNPTQPVCSSPADLTIEQPPSQ